MGSTSDQLFVPASVLKVLTVAAALEHLGADYRWRTRLMSKGPIRDSVLEGDLIIEPGADPTWGHNFFEAGPDQPLTNLAQQIRGRGVTKVNGDLVVDMSRFPGRPHPTDRSYGDLPYRYGTPTAALAVNEATVMVRVAPGKRVGEPATIKAPAGIEVVNLTTTVGRKRHGLGTLDFVPVWGTNMLLLRGEYPISEKRFIVAASDPAPAYRAAERLRQALDDAGVTVKGAVRLQSRPIAAPDQLATLAEIRSTTLEKVLDRILRKSHNWYADMLTLTLALEVTGSGRFDDGVEVITDFVTGILPDGEPTDAHLWLQDGSSLSPSNLVTPVTVVRVLAHALKRPWGKTLVDALAENGAGTLVAWPRLPSIAAKTGTPRHTIALAGILDSGLDGPVVFCYFVNHHPKRPRSARREIASALHGWRAASTAP